MYCLSSSSRSIRLKLLKRRRQQTNCY
jgi:hypothetical protein